MALLRWGLQTYVQCGPHARCFPEFPAQVAPPSVLYNHVVFVFFLVKSHICWTEKKA